jgi:hypothetical protein
MFLLGLTWATSLAQGAHEYAPLEHKIVNYTNWILPSLTDEQVVDLRTLMNGKKLVMIVYFASWCPNWRYEAPIAASLYRKYKDRGFEVIGVSEYASRADVRTYFGEAGPPYPVVIESESREDREKTPHFGFRQLTGDSRRWGSPWNIFLEPSTLAKSGEVLTEKAWVVNGELVEAEIDKFIQERLNESSASAVIEPCKN